MPKCARVSTRAHLSTHSASRRRRSTTPGSAPSASSGLGAAAAVCRGRALERLLRGAAASHTSSAAAAMGLAVIRTRRAPTVRHRRAQARPQLWGEVGGAARDPGCSLAPPSPPSPPLPPPPLSTFRAQSPEPRAPSCLWLLVGGRRWRRGDSPGRRAGPPNFYPLTLRPDALL